MASDTEIRAKYQQHRDRGRTEQRALDAVADEYDLEDNYVRSVVFSPTPVPAPTAATPPTPTPEPAAEFPAKPQAPLPVEEPTTTLLVAIVPEGATVHPVPVSDLALSASSAPRPPTLPTEPAMSQAADLYSLVGRAIPAALALHKVQIDEGTLEAIAETIGDVARRAARKTRRGPLSTEQRDELVRDACDEVSCVAPDLASSAVERLGEIVIDVLDEHTDTGPLDAVDGEIAKRGLAALGEKLEDWLAPRGNLQARAQRARERAARQIAKAERLEGIAALKR